MNSKPTSSFRDPLAVNIIWAGAGEMENDRVFETYVQHLIEFYDRSLDDPMRLSLGLPVYLLSGVQEIQGPLVFDRSWNSVSIVLVDREMEDTEEWYQALRELRKAHTAAGPRHLLLPVSLLEEEALSLPFDNLPLLVLDTPGEVGGLMQLLIGVTHQMCRHVLRWSETEGDENEPLSIFISHTRENGVELGRLLEQRIKTTPELSTFLEAEDRPQGYDFDRQLQKRLKRSVLLVLQTDDYSTREWCRREIVLAKQLNRPVIVLNLFSGGENRTFPYVGNVPHLRIAQLNVREEEPWEIAGPTGEHYLLDLIILNVLREALRFAMFALNIRHWSEALSVSVDHVFAYAPELLTLGALPANQTGIVVYPDPPLGQIELDILQSARPNYTFLTPTYLPVPAYNAGKLGGLVERKIGLSLSEVNDGRNVRLTNLEIRALITDLAKYLLVDGATLNYGGIFTYEQHVAVDRNTGFNFVQLLQQLVGTYRMVFNDDEGERIKPIENYTFFPINELISKKQRRRLDRVINFHDIPLPADLDHAATDARALSQMEQNDDFSVFVKRYCWARSLTEMREQMLDREDARIALGGKWTGFRGKLPGALEEVLLALGRKLPVYILGGFGGVAAGLAKALKGETVSQLDSAYYRETDLEYLDFIDRFNSEIAALEKEEVVDLTEIGSRLRETGATSNDFGLNNGLSREENLRLFVTTSTQEIIYLLQKGLYQTHT